MRKLTPYLFVLPSLVLLVIFTIIPIVQGFYLALFRAGPRTKDFVGLYNFTFLFTKEPFQKALYNTFWYVLLCVPALTIIPLILAMAINRMMDKWQNIYRTVFCLPFLVSAPVLGAIFKWFYSMDGLINTVTRQRVSWLGSNPAALISTSIVHIITGTGIPILIYLAGLKNIPKSYIESALVDGATKGQINRLITVPLMLPLVEFVVVITTIGTFQIFGTIYMLTHGGPNFGTVSLIYLAYEYAFTQGEYGLGSAVCVVLFAIMLVFISLQMALRRRLQWS